MAFAQITFPLILAGLGGALRFAAHRHPEFRERLNRTTDQAWVPDLIVRETRRSGGVGLALLERAYDIARERGCWELTLESGASVTNLSAAAITAVSAWRLEAGHLLKRR